MSSSSDISGDSTAKVGRTRVILSQVVACLALDLLLVDLGMSVSFVTMVLPDVLGAREGLSIDEGQASWFGSIAFLCQPLGSIFSGLILDYFGRKKALFIVNIPHLAAWILMCYAWNVPSLFFANALLGIGTGIMEAPSVTYIGEICDPSIRGILTTLTNGFTATGMFIAYLLGSVLPWRQAALVSLVVPVTSMLLVLLVPETPIWLLSKGRQKEALRSLCRLRGWARPEDVKEEFDELVKYNALLQQCVVCAKTKHQNPCPHENYNPIKLFLLTLKHVLLTKETLRPFTLVMAYFLFHTMSGLHPLKPNMVNVCKALGMEYDPKTIVVGVGAVFIVMGLLSAVIIKMIGKRKLVLSSMLATVCCCVALSHYSSYLPDVFSYEPETFPTEKSVIPVVLFMLLVCFTALGIPWVFLSEVFPFRSRGIATGLAAAFAYGIFFLAAKTNYNIERNFHLSGTFAFYGVIGLIGTVYLYFFLPETENRTLAEIESYYQGKHRIFADDFLINSLFKNRKENVEANKPMLVI